MSENLDSEDESCPQCGSDRKAPFVRQKGDNFAPSSRCKSVRMWQCWSCGNKWEATDGDNWSMGPPTERGGQRVA